MHVVDKLFVGPQYSTDVWITEAALDELYDFAEKDKDDKKNKKNLGIRFIQKLQYFAESGFRLHEGGKGPIRYEGDGAYRIGIPASLFRLYGFYADEEERPFIVIYGLLKRKKKLSSLERDKLKTVARIKRDGDWHRGK